MTLLQRYRRLTPWNKLGVCGALASIIGLLLALTDSPSISQQTHGNLSPAIANNSGTLINSAELLDAYYQSPERAAYGEHVGSHIAKIEVREVEGVVGQVPVANM